MTLLIAMLALWGADIIHLGTITEKRMIFLEKCTNRVDFEAFNIEIQSMADTNRIYRLNKTNEFLKFEDFAGVPEGRVALAVQIICADGAVSAPNLYRLDVKRTIPDAPKAVMVTILDGTPRVTAGPDAAPARSLIREALQSRQLDLTNHGPPLPSGEMMRHYNRTGRRNE